MPAFPSASFSTTASAGSLGSFTCVSGVCTATYTAPNTVGSPTIGATIGATAISGSPQTVTVTAGAAARLVITGTGTQTAGASQTITITAYDANGNIATEFTARARPDGHTIYVHTGSSMSANMHTFKKPPVDAGKQIQVAATFNRQPFMLVVDAKSPYKSVAELTAAMKQKGDKATYATAAPTGKIMGEIYKLATGIKAVEVSYKTAPDSLNELTSGKLDYGMHDPVFSLAQQREGRLRILGISTGQRLKATGDAPTMSEQGVKMDLTGWWGAMVPTGTPEPVIQQINQWFTFIAQTDETTKFLNSFGGDVWVSSHAEAQKYFVQQIAAWRDFVRLAKIEPQ